MSSPPTRRSFIKRMRHFNETAAMIMKALRVIMAARNESFTDASIKDLAVFHARRVESACWASGMRMTDAEYKVLAMAKAQQICSAIVMATLKDAAPGEFCSAIVMATLTDAAPGELCHPWGGTPDPALDGPAGCAGLVRPERQRRATDASAPRAM